MNAELPLLDLDEKPKLIDLDTYDEQQKDDSIVQLIKNLDTGKLSKSLEKSLIVIDNVLYLYQMLMDLHVCGCIYQIILLM